MNRPGTATATLHFMGHCGQKQEKKGRVLIFEHSETGKLEFVMSRFAISLSNCDSHFCPPAILLTSPSTAFRTLMFLLFYTGLSCSRVRGQVLLACCRRIRSRNSNVESVCFLENNDVRQRVSIPLRFGSVKLFPTKINEQSF